MNRYDLVIVGGGMAGLTLLAALEPAIQAGLSVSLIDPAKQLSSDAPASPSFDDRATALSAQALDTLSSLSLQDLPNHISNISDIEVSDQGHAGFHQMSAVDQGLTRFGAIIANRALGSLLWLRCRPLNVDFRFEQQVTRIDSEQDGHLLHLGETETIRTSLLILCEGGRSELSEQMGFNHLSHPFNARARIATLSTEIPHHGRAFERFTTNGPIALLPFGEFSALVWTVPEQHIASYPSEKQQAIAWLNKHFGQRLGRIKAMSDWHEYPLKERALTTLVAHNCLILGNAAATLHPVAGQGFNLAVRGIVRAATMINKLYLSDKDLPDFHQLNELSQDILRDQQTTVFASRKLIDIFGSRNPILQLGRGIGLNSLDRHPTFSQLFALAGMGYIASTPVV